MVTIQAILKFIWVLEGTHRSPDLPSSHVHTDPERGNIRPTVGIQNEYKNLSYDRDRMSLLWWMTSKVSHAQRNCHYSIGCVSLSIIAVYSNNVSILHGFWDVTTFAVYVTACNLKKFSSFDIRFMCKHARYVPLPSVGSQFRTIANTKTQVYRFSVTFKLLVLMPLHRPYMLSYFVFHCYCVFIYSFRDTVRYFSK